MKELSQFFLIQSAILIISFFILWFHIPVGGSLDLYLISPWIDALGKFHLRNNWYLATLNHRYVKILLS